MAQELSGKKVAILVADGFEQVEMTEPRRALEEAGAGTDLIASRGGKVKGWQHDHWGEEFDVDVKLKDADSEDYDALVIPGGVQSPDKLRTDERAVRLVKAFMAEGKPVASICHGPWLLAEADVVRGRRVTGCKSIQTDLKNAGGQWVDEEVVVDQGLVTSRGPKDLPAFNRKTIEEIREGRHERRESQEFARSH